MTDITLAADEAGTAQENLLAMLGQARLLVVDDSKLMRMGIIRALQQQGVTRIEQADNGQTALDRLKNESFDLMLLDVQMPHMTGIEVLAKLQADPLLKGFPVIVISGGEDIQDVVQCIEMGAEDYLPKPFSPVLLRARLTSSIEKKRLRDLEKMRLAQLQTQHELLAQEQAKTESVLLNILPKVISQRLKSGETLIADAHNDVTVLFADLVGFTTLSNGISAEKLVSMLNDIMSAFDLIANQEWVEKIKTIGDCYMLASGIPLARPDHAQAVVRTALAMLAALESFNQQQGAQLQIRVGIHSGPVVAGVIGVHKYTYDLWGGTVNIASRMESTGLPGHIHVSTATAQLIRDDYTLESRGPVSIKGIGEVETFLIV
jgi:class 3 adenylate cyclase/CheY-like chemotaxis protein